MEIISKAKRQLHLQQSKQDQTESNPFHKSNEDTKDLESYMPLSSMWVDFFAKYRASHVMADLMAKLTVGLDAISIEFLERHSILMDVARIADHALVKKDFAWTEEDKRRFAVYEQEVERNAFVKKLNRTVASCITNVYGLYDLPPEIFAYINGKDIIDGGAFIGETATLFCEKFPESKCFCFDPDPNSFPFFEVLVASEIAAGRVERIPCGLSDVPSSLEFSISSDPTDLYGDSSFYYRLDEVDKGGEGSTVLEQNARAQNAAASGAAGPGQKIVKAVVDTIDNFVIARHLNVGLIKLDIEGFEPNAIRGALQTLQKDRPVLVVAIYHTPEEMYELKPFIESLDLGYKFMVRRSSLSEPLGELVLIAYPEL